MSALQTPRSALQQCGSVPTLLGRREELILPSQQWPRSSAAASLRPMSIQQEVRSRGRSPARDTGSESKSRRFPLPLVLQVDQESSLWQNRPLSGSCTTLVSVGLPKQNRVVLRLLLKPPDWSCHLRDCDSVQSHSATRGDRESPRSGHCFLHGEVRQDEVDLRGAPVQGPA